MKISKKADLILTVVKLAQSSIFCTILSLFRAFKVLYIYRNNQALCYL